MTRELQSKTKLLDIFYHIELQEEELVSCSRVQQEYHQILNYVSERKQEYNGRL